MVSARVDGAAEPAVHVKSALFCSRAGPLRHEMLDFYNGVSLDDLPLLAKEVAAQIFSMRES